MTGFADAVALHLAGRLDAAIAAYGRLIDHAPGDFACRLNRAIALSAQGGVAAEPDLRAALAIVPDHAGAWGELGIVRRRQDRSVAAADAYARSVTLDPNFADGWNNRAVLASRQMRPTAAAADFRRALALNPAAVSGWSGLGVCALEIGALVDAAINLRRTLQLDPRARGAMANLLHGLATLGADEAYDDAVRRYAATWPPAPARPKPRVKPDRLRIGYVSPDFRTHSCAHFLWPVLSAHDAATVTVFAYATSAQSDEMTARFAGAVGRFQTVADLDAAALASRLRNDGIDVLIDLGGLLEGGRPDLFALGAAPAQAVWLGYNAATGVPAIDWRIADGLILPDPPAEWMSERPWRLPRLAHAFDPLRAVALTPRAAGPLRFGSFNNLSKLTEATLAVWAAILRQRPDARLVLKSRQAADAGARRRILAILAGQGVAAERIDFLPYAASGADHLQAYAFCDVALDPFPYNGVTTTCEALWMGVPVVALRGQRMIARIAAGFLDAAGLQAGIATTPEGYVAAALALADRRPARGEVRAAMAASPAMDGPGLARALEAAYLAMAQ